MILGEQTNIFIQTINDDISVDNFACLLLCLENCVGESRRRLEFKSVVSNYTVTSRREDNLFPESGDGDTRPGRGHTANIPI